MSLRHHLIPILLALPLATSLLVADAGSAQTTDEARVIAAVDALFRAMRAKDAAALEAVLLPGAQLLIVGGDTPRWSSGEGFVRSISGAQGELIERMWDPQVRIDGDMAQLWAPYDFYRGQEFSHCGVDAVHLARLGGEWKIGVITYQRAQPPACEMHPDGAPKRGV